MLMVMAFAKTRARIEEYAKGKSWRWHLPPWLFGVYAFYELLSFDLRKPLPLVLQVPHAFDFMLHEFAHVFTAWLPAIMTAAAGSFSELLLGGLLVYGAFQFRNYFASLFCCLWMMLVCFSVGGYMVDAVPQAIPLVSLGGALAGSEQTIHDWHFIFGQLGMLDSSAFIGNVFRAAGIAFGLFGLIFSAWVMYKMASSKDKKPMTKEDLATLKHAAAPQSTTEKANIYPMPVRGGLADTSRYDPPPRPKDLGQGGGT